MNPIPKKTPEIEPPQQPEISPSIPEIKPDPEKHDPMPVMPRISQSRTGAGYCPV